MSNLNKERLIDYLRYTINDLYITDQFNIDQKNIMVSTIESILALIEMGGFDEKD